jgi:methionine-S-sulfoxide reductase
MMDFGDTKGVATFAGGCFWCMVPPFANLPGVNGVIAGYTGGNVPNPVYEAVCSGGTGHYEAVQVYYDPLQISYRKLLEIFWRQIDPTDAGGQFYDRGASYLTAIFYHDEEQKKAALESLERITASGRFQSAVVTRVLPAGEFYAAEDYHQAYHEKNPLHYKSYRMASGRDAFIRRHWDRSK